MDYNMPQHLQNAPTRTVYGPQGQHISISEGKNAVSVAILDVRYPEGSFTYSGKSIREVTRKIEDEDLFGGLVDKILSVAKTKIPPQPELSIVAGHA
ncbi:hypothetical protein GOV04_01380 [Candidatus Woesearchaeota archaeon]|nr:hypothetical protein [Candidatus Woesearchaeota archaeon]